MSTLLILLHLFIGSTLAGVGLVVLLVAGQATAFSLSAAIALGYLLAFPVARYVERGMRG